MALPSLRRSPAIEGPRPRITTAAGRRGAKSHLSPASRSAPSAAPGAAPAGTGVRRCRGFRSAVGADSISARRRALRQRQVSGSGKRRWPIRKAPRPSAAQSMRLQGISTTEARRRVDGAVDSAQADSHGPALRQISPGRGALPPGIFSFDRPRPFASGLRAAYGGWPPARACGCSLFVLPKRKWGRIPRGKPALPPGPPAAGQAQIRISTPRARR